MKYDLLFKPTAVKDLKKLPKAVQHRIKSELEYYLEQDDSLDYAIPLIGHNIAGQDRFRVGDYRIVFDKMNNVLAILYIEDRREVYKGK